MQKKTEALRRASRVSWGLAALALCAGALTAPAALASPPAQKGALASWGSYHPRGWSAGSVSIGTGYHWPGASLRVRDVQRRLNRLGYRAGKVDGLFGPVTDAAVRRYQGDQALASDGIVGPVTLRGLHAQTRTARGTADGRSQARRTVTSPANDKSTASEIAAAVGGALALLLLLGGMAYLVRRPLARAVDRARLRLTPIGHKPAHPRTLFVEGHSQDERIGDFSGFAYTIWPVEGEGDQADDNLSLLVYDSSKQRPVSARLSEITSVNGRRLREASRPKVARVSSGPRSDALRITRRIDTLPAASATTPDGHGFLWLGARVHTGRAKGVATLPGTLLVELELFAETRSCRWETDVLRTGGPFRISASDFEDSVRHIVVPDWVPRLADALADVGVAVDTDELAQLPFAVERTIEVERAIAESEVFRLRVS